MILMYLVIKRLRLQGVDSSHSQRQWVPTSIPIDQEPEEVSVPQLTLEVTFP